MFGAFRGSLRGANSVRGVVTQSASLAPPDLHREAHAGQDGKKDQDWISADVERSSDGTTLEARFSEPMTNEELEAARLAMLASYESAASEGSDSSVDSVEEINPDDQMRMAESRRSEGIMVGSVMDFALSLAKSKRVQESVFAEIMANPEMNAELRAMFAQHGLRVTLDDTGAPSSHHRALLEAGEVLPLPQGAEGVHAHGRGNPLEHLVHAVVHALGDAGNAVTAYLGRLRGHIQRLICHLQGAKGKNANGEGMADSDDDGTNPGLALLELASAVATVLVVAVFLRRLPLHV